MHESQFVIIIRRLRANCKFKKWETSAQNHQNQSLILITHFSTQPFFSGFLRRVTGQVADKPTRQQDNSRLGQRADAKYYATIVSITSP